MEAPTLSATAPPTLEYLRVIWARKWVVILAVLLVPAVALSLELRKQALYQSSATVLLKRGNLAGNLNGLPDASAYQQADRVAQTQADLARAPTVVRRTLASAGLTSRSPGDFLARSTVSSRSNADLLDFQVTAATPSSAAFLANEYARQFTIYERELATTEIQRALTDVQQRIDELRAAGNGRGALYSDLTGKAQQLQAIQTLQTPNSVVVSAAQGASQVQPRPEQSVILGLGVGIVFGMALAFLSEALDTRVRSAEELGERLGLPLLGRVPAPTGPLFRASREPLLLEPNDVRADAFRMLRVGLDLMNLELPSRTLMVTSAVDGGEKSMTVANLALAFARAGRRVVLVDLDLRNPRLDHLLTLDRRPGLIDVALESTSLEEALVPVEVNERDGDRANHDGSGWSEGALEILPCGETFPNAGEFFGSRTLADILEKLAARADLVMIDAPPLLGTGDAFTLSSRVEAVVLVTRLNAMRRPMLTEVRRLLETCPARKLGFVLALSRREGYPSSLGAHPKPRQKSWIASRRVSSQIGVLRKLSR
jgi:capsular exopolysaccharide synthesis family protein